MQQKRESVKRDKASGEHWTRAVKRGPLNDEQRMQRKREEDQRDKDRVQSKRRDRLYYGGDPDS